MGLHDDPFSYTTTAAGELRITRSGRVVTVLRGASAARILNRLGVSDERDQQVLARATGNYRRGNERR